MAQERITFICKKTGSECTLNHPGDSTYDTYECPNSDTCRVNVSKTKGGERYLVYVRCNAQTPRVTSERFSD